MSVCRSCKAPITWAVAEVSGKAIPLDTEPVDNGNIVIVGTDETLTPIVGYLRKDTGPHDQRTRYVSHFATCKDAKQWRRHA